MNTIQQNLLNIKLCGKCRKYQSFYNKDLENNTNYCNCLEVKDEIDDEVNKMQVNKKEIEEEKEKKNVDSKAKGEEEDEKNLEIFKIDETKEEMKDITRKEINDEKDKSINNVKQREHLNDENYENEIKMLERGIESNEEEEEVKEEEEVIEEEEEEKEEVLSGKNNLMKLLKNMNQYMNKNDILNWMNDEEKYKKETFYLNCPHCNRELLYHGKDTINTICLKTCRHILCRYCISTLLQKFIHNEIIELRCPYFEVTQCNALIDEAKDNIEGLVNPNLYKKYLMSLAKELKDNIKNTVVCCITLNCKGWCIIEDDSVDNFLCPICKRNNYINLKANKNEIEDTYENEYMQNERYNELMLLMANDFVPNFEPFECPICFVPYKPQEGLVLKNCLHTFCKTCLANTVLFSDHADVKCPYKDENYSCEGTIQQSEIKAKIHKVNCTEDMLNEESSDSKSDFLIQQMLNNKNALPCPTCNTIIMKIDGCDAVVCTICKTEICWLTRGPRWGPKGRGDTSGGCKCNVKVKCHPNCRNCH
ncbi:ranBP-type and C3HC4-type zinc finger-containing protein 1-like isoform X2 [Vespa velutina]|uniref:ranBP-type and C3HC4-type zinc finger-containing protein 1-like isoform X2 n=1 Tax=Vespa velutina TaxID=202808 RepID=UPI001FB22984|nr:ranBP-type and C3HC4-type zinc finger-containing protein 1-like isoform X2 [Vespa velutina]